MQTLIISLVSLAVFSSFSSKKQENDLGYQIKIIDGKEYFYFENLPTGPDLVISDVYFPTSVSSSNTNALICEYTIKNVGSTNAGQSKTFVQIEYAPYQFASEIHLNKPLVPTEEDEENRVRFDATTASSWIVVSLEIDYYDDVTETNESNNSEPYTIAIQVI